MQSFTELPLDEDILATLVENKYEIPTPIQAETLPILLGEPTDFLGLAATGTGKTLAFGLPLVQKINAKDRHPQALILCPTRELAQQVSNQIQILGRSRRLGVATIFGGAGYGDQIKSLRAGAQVVVATPGRLVDHLDRGTINLSKVKTVILDEADEMISMGFKDDLEMILSKVKGEDEENSTGNIWLFSATMSTDVKKVAHKFLKDPKTVQINSKTVLSGTVEQLYYMTKEGDKPEILGKIIDLHDSFYGLVFCQTKLLVTNLTSLLQGRGYKVDSLHGDKPQAERERILARFRARDLQIVICTDVAARGLDVKELTHVVNYSIPRELENYIHRIGRTGRSGSKGIAISLVTPSHLPLIGRIEKITKTKIDRGTVPSNADVGKKKVARIITKFKEAKNWEKALEFINSNFATEIAEMSSAELLSRVLASQNADLFSTRELHSGKLMSNGETTGEHRARGIRPQNFGQSSGQSSYDGGRDGGRDRYPSRQGGGERREWTPSRERSDSSSRPSFGGARSDRGSSGGGSDRGPRGFGGGDSRPSSTPSGAPSSSRSERTERSDFRAPREEKRGFGTFKTFDDASTPEIPPRRQFSGSAGTTARKEFGGETGSAPRRERSSEGSSFNSRREFGERKFAPRKSASAEAGADRPRRTSVRTGMTPPDRASDGEGGGSIRDKYKTRRAESPAGQE